VCLTDWATFILTIFRHVIQNSLKMFADDTKIWRKIEKDDDSKFLQSDLHSMKEWSDKRQLKFNPKKCKVMHISHKCNISYEMVDNGVVKRLEEVTEEKDLGVYVTLDLKPSTQCTKAANKARSVSRMVKRNFPKMDKEDFNILYKTYI